jgi:hypothetical protein
MRGVRTVGELTVILGKRGKCRLPESHTPARNRVMTTMIAICIIPCSATI